MKKTLCSQGDYTIDHEYEATYLRWPGGHYPVGEHYGEPTCAVINEIDGWCVTGGEGLVVTAFEQGFPLRNDAARRRVTQRSLWRCDSFSPPTGLRWFVFGAWLAGPDQVQVVVDPGSDHAGLYEVDVRTLAWQKL